MIDRISLLPDEIVSHILSFLQTKESVATCVLSKRFKPLWRSVPTLNFEDSTHFVDSVNAFLLSRDSHAPLHTLRLRCTSFRCGSAEVNEWVNAPARRKIQHLHLSLPPSVKLSPLALGFETLAELKLTSLSMEPFSTVRLPSLKLLYVYFVVFAERSHFAELVSAGSNLEVLHVSDVKFRSSAVETRFRRLPKLVRARFRNAHVPLGVVKNVQFLREDLMDEQKIIKLEGENVNRDHKHLIPEFLNLTIMKLGYLEYTNNWLDVLAMLMHCSKLRTLVLEKRDVQLFVGVDEGEDWAYPQSVPACISLHLKTCYLKSYGGSKGEFRFAKYIMWNANNLRIMAISSYINASEMEKLSMLKKLSLCKRASESCKLLFK